MFKNCCGCASKKTKRKGTEEEEDEEEKKKEEEVVVKEGRLDKEATAKDIAQKDEAALSEKATAAAAAAAATVEATAAAAAAATATAVQRKPSLKKPKPRLSISTEVKIIPSNFPEMLSDYPDEAEGEEEKKSEEEEEGEEDEEEEEVTVVKISVKNIDGKIIKKSIAEENEEAAPPSSERRSPPGEATSDRPISPLSDEVFVASEKSALELPLHNLGVRVGSTQTTGSVVGVGSTQTTGSAVGVGSTQTPANAVEVGSTQTSNAVETGSTQTTNDVETGSTQTTNAVETGSTQTTNAVEIGSTQTPGVLLDLPPASVASQGLKRSSMPAALHRWLSEEEDEMGGNHEPPATPVARDELALRRHRFFSELLTVAQAATEHRVRFDPFGPTVERLSDTDQGAVTLQAKEFEALLARLENITSRLEKAVPVLEKSIEPIQSSVVVTKSLEDLLDEHLTPAEKENLNLLIGRQESADSSSKRVVAEDGSVISPDSSADIEDLSDKDITLDGRVDGIDRLLNGGQSDRSEEASTNSQSTVVKGSGQDPGEDKISDQQQQQQQLEEESDMTNSQSTLSMSVQGFQDILQGPFATYLQLSAKIGGDVGEQATLVQQAFQAQFQYLTTASQVAKPSDDENSKLLKPTSERIMAIQDFREKKRGSTYFNHLSAVSESIPALGWVTVSPTPAPHIKEMNDAGQFYTNRVLTQWKEKDPVHADWTKAWIQTLSELQAYVKQYHTTGLVWSGTAAAPRVGGVPPPPPVGMPPPIMDFAEVAGDSKTDRSALFAEINQGENIIKGLKKVTADMQTHKNPALRTGPAPFKTPTYVSNSSPAPFKAVSPPEKPPKFAKEGKKWIIEYHKDNRELVVEGAEMNNVVYIFKCWNTNVVVKGKVNSIFVDSCTKTAVVFDNLVSSIEFVNCQSVQMQVLGKVPTISVDKTDGCQMYLSKDSLDTEIISSKSSEMNVLVPTSNGDYTEYPVPEQFKTLVGKKGLTTTPVENAE